MTRRNAYRGVLRPADVVSLEISNERPLSPRNKKNGKNGAIHKKTAHVKRNQNGSNHTAETEIYSPNKGDDEIVNFNNPSPH